MITTSSSADIAAASPDEARLASPPAICQAQGDGCSSVIDPDVEIRGQVVSRSNRALLIQGSVDGEVVADGTVIVAEGGAIRGPVSARKLVVHGSVDCRGARVEVRGLLAMRKGGAITAEAIAYGDLELERGARLVGALQPLDIPADADPVVDVVAPRPEEEDGQAAAPAHAATPASVAWTGSVVTPLRPPIADQEDGAIGGRVSLELVVAGPPPACSAPFEPVTVDRSGQDVTPRAHVAIGSPGATTALHDVVHVPFEGLAPLPLLGGR